METSNEHLSGPDANCPKAAPKGQVTPHCVTSRTDSCLYSFVSFPPVRILTSDSSQVHINLASLKSAAAHRSFFVKDRFIDVRVYTFPPANGFKDTLDGLHGKANQVQILAGAPLHVAAGFTTPRVDLTGLTDVDRVHNK
jgi:hypothetical protein